MKKLYLFAALIVSLNSFSQDVFMQNGSFNRCSPDKLYDSGGASGNYNSNENYVTTICAINPGDFIILDFTAFNTQLGQDILKIYNGPDISSPLLGTYSGSPSNSPGRISATSINTSGCLTLQFISDSGGTGIGFAADILCAEPCQTITPSIDSTTPIPSGSGVITIFPGESVNFNGSATFSGNGTGATYSWNFADGSPAAPGQSVFHTFNNAGTFNVIFTVTDTNPQGCSVTSTIPVLVLRPIVTINNLAYPESLYTPQQLIEDVLVSGGCSAVDNFSVRVSGDPDDLQTKSYGYFTKGGAVNFPFEEGIIMTSGRAYAGGNLRNDSTVDFNNNLSGDTDLEAALGQPDTEDATFIKFNFVPTSDTISFRYILASEEYNNFYECIYSDSFAFLLREAGTSAYTNIAVLPDGITPVSTTNISVNPDCPANPEYFEGYNSNVLSGTIRDTNYNGRTQVLTAVANVTMGVTYEIKLVMADQNDPLWDSAIFLEAGSFVLGGELGDDITIASGTAQCDGNSVQLDTQASNAIHTWYQDGVVIPGETGPTINVNETATYGVDVFFAAGCERSDTVFVEFYPTITLDTTIDNLFLCNPGASPYVFDLTQNDALILESVTNPENYTIAYYESQAEADSDMNPIATPNIYSGTDGQSIFARLEYQSSGCYDTSSFTLNIIAQPTINSVPDLTTCDDFSSNGIEQFNLESQTSTILGVQPSASFNVTYYTSFAEADSGSNALVSPFSNTINPQPIYVRLENTGDANCITVSPNPVFNLIVNDRALANPPNGLFICDDVVNDGIGQFNLLQQTSTILGSQSQTDYTVTYHESQMDAETNNSIISNPSNYMNTSNLQTIYARVFRNTTPDCYGLTDFTLTVNPLPTITDPTPLVVCDDNVPDGVTSMDLGSKDDEITGGNASYTVSYHLDLSGASSGMSPLPIPYTNLSNGQTVHVRVENSSTGCYSVTTLVLQVAQAPVAFVPSPLFYCDPDNNGWGMFDLTDAEAQITGGATGLTLSYHETMVNAQNNADPLPTDYQNIVRYQQTLYVRIVNAALTTDCATIVPLVLDVLPTPVVPFDISDYAICDTDPDGFAEFDLSTKIPEILGGQSPSDYVLTFHLSQAGAGNGTAQIMDMGNYTNVQTPEQTIYVRLEGSNGCDKTGQFTIRVDLPPVAVQPTELDLCDDPVADEHTTFDLTVKDSEITNGDGSLSVGYYATSADAQADSNAIAPATSYTNTSVNGLPANPQTLYVRVTDTGTGCTSFTTLTIRVLPNPTPATDAPDMVMCDDINTGDGQEVFDLTGNESYILDGALGLTVTYHTTIVDAESGSGAIAVPSSYTNPNTDFTARTIYVRVANGATGCYAIVDFDILVNPLPGVVAVTDYIICEVGTDGFAQFDLPSKDVEVLNGQDPSRFTVTYHAAQTGADNLTGALLSPYTNTSGPQRIYVAITDNVTGCSISTPSFSLEVDNGAEANSDLVPIEQVVCDNIGDNDGLGQFDLTGNDTAVLDGQDPQDFTVTYYATGAGAELGTGPIPYTYENTSNPQVIYARVDNDERDAAGMDSSICYAVVQLTLRVDLLPIFDLADTYTLCVGTNGTEVVGAPVLDTGLSATGYTFMWSLDGTELPGETGAGLTADQGGTYSVVVTDIATTCTNTDSALVEISSPPSVAVEVTTEAFSEEHTIVAVATGEGDYEYSLDGGPWQDSGTFGDVSFGWHTVTARDTNGCGLAEGSVTVLDYPHFFTPNGDGRNETWNIVGFAGQPSAKIYIFDRFGKLLKQISPSGPGWNGTYNGEPMPSSDYWFTVEYSEPSTGQQKQFNAHFTLKR